MSHSKSITKEFGGLKVLVDKRIQLGSTSETNVVITPSPVALTDDALTLTVSQVKSGLLIQTPTTSRTLTLPTAALMRGFLSAVGNTIDLTIVNLGADTHHVTLAVGAGGSLVGFGVVRDSSATTDAASGSGTFKIRMTNVTPASEAYVVYRTS
jgi:hypothetical protein